MTRLMMPFIAALALFALAGHAHAAPLAHHDQVLVDVAPDVPLAGDVVALVAPSSADVLVDEHLPIVAAGDLALPSRTVPLFGRHLRLTRHRDLRDVHAYLDSIVRVERTAPVPALRC